MQATGACRECYQRHSALVQVTIASNVHLYAFLGRLEGLLALLRKHVEVARAISLVELAPATASKNRS